MVDRITLKDIADTAMQQRGLEPDFPAAAQQEAEALTPTLVDHDPAMRDLRSLLWCSIDNDDSRDLDQLTVAQHDADDGQLRVLVHPIAEGRIVQGFERLDVADRVRVELVAVDAAQGFIDFKRVN
jgi:hypothetical protein